MAQSGELFPRTRYVIDTSSFVDAGLESDPEKVWTGLMRLCRDGGAFTVSYVYPELKRMSESVPPKLPLHRYEELKRLKQRIIVPDPDIIMEAGRINSAYPKLGDMFDRRNRADPWIIAAAKMKGLTVVTEEADTGRRKTHKIPWICDQEGVGWIRVSRLVIQEKFLE
jgi:predicted nucleic acid-binding protein